MAEDFLGCEGFVAGVAAAIQSLTHYHTVVYGGRDLKKICNLFMTLSTDEIVLLGIRAFKSNNLQVIELGQIMIIFIID